GIEPAPGDSEHSNFAVRPGLTGEPGDDLFAVELLLLRVFAVGGRAFARAKAADVYARADVSAGCEIAMDRIVAGRGGVVFTIGKVFQQGGEFFARLGVVRHIERSRKPDAVRHGNPFLDHADRELSARDG